MSTVHSGASTVSTQFQTYYSKKLLPHAVQATVLAQFGQKVPYPKNVGGLTLGWMRPTGAAVNSSGLVAEVNTVTIGSTGSSNQEGVPVATFRDQTYTYVTKAMSQYTEATKISDIMTWSALYDALEIGIMVMGEDVALHLDSLVRNEIVGALTTAGENKRYAGGGTQTFAALKALAPTSCTLQIADVLDAMTYLTNQRAPKQNGEYMCVVAPAVNRDILNDPKVVLAGQYGQSKGLMNGESGRWYGVRVLVGTNPFIEDAAGSEGTYSNPAISGAANTGNIYRSLVLGSDGFGIPNLASGGTSPFGPKVYICDKADKSDPANQFITAALKTFWAVKTLNASWMCSLSSKSTFSP